MTRAHLAGPLAVAAAAAMSLPAPAPGAAPRFRLWRVSRIDAAAATLDMTVTVATRGDAALAVAFAVRGRGSARTARLVTSFEATRTGAHVYHGGSTWTPCPTAPGCGPAAARDVHLTVDSGEPTREVFYLLTEQATARLTVRSKGWKVREVTATPVRRILAEHSSATGVSTSTATVELFTGASAAGGRYGSLAVAAVACELAGAGTARLTRTPSPPAGHGERTMRCSGQVTGHTTSDSAAGRVSWRVDGSVVGAGDEPTRLLVIDLPA